MSPPAEAKKTKESSKKESSESAGGGIRVATAEFAAGAATKAQVPAPSIFEDAPEIAFAGRSNVGKSSLLNMLLARRGLARTSNTPGCTRQINFFDIGLARASTSETTPRRMVFVDLPGYGYAKVSKAEGKGWKELLEGYLQSRPTLRAVVVLADVRRGLEQEEADLIEFLEQRPELALVVVATKIDKISRSARKPAIAKLRAGMNGGAAGPSKRSLVATSGETGEGREELWARILDACRVH